MSPSNVSFITSTADCPRYKTSFFCFRAGNASVELCESNLLCVSHKFVRSSSWCAQLTTTCTTTTDASKRFVEKALWIGDGGSTFFRKRDESNEYGWVLCSLRSDNFLFNFILFDTLDSNAFDAKSYYEQLIMTSSLPTLIKRENDLITGTYLSFL